MKPKYMTTPEMEIALSTWFDYRTNLIVPNVHWGMNMHECDLLIVSKAGYVTEVEIKRTRSDLRADVKKRHGHFCTRIKYLYFALPEFLESAFEFVPQRAGIILISPKTETSPPRCRRFRDPIGQKNAPKMSDSDRYKIARLGTLRIWNLKRKLL